MYRLQAISTSMVARVTVLNICSGAIILGMFVGVGDTALLRAADPPIVVVAYGDTRTGLWGLGDNKKQRTHKVVVETLLDTVKSIDAVIFTGDAVMTTFPLWRQKYFKDFFDQTNKIVGSGTTPKVPFYPSLGNHETAAVPVLQVPLQQPSIATFTTEPAPQQPLESRVSSAYDRGEEAAAAAEPQLNVSTRDAKTELGEKQLKAWEKDITTGTPQQRERAAFGLGLFEGALQKDFHDQSSDRRCQGDGKILFENYINDAKYQYLDGLIAGGSRSFYSIDIQRATKVRLIALDTNCLDYPPQLAFFKNQVEQFDGVVIVYGHHPPIQPAEKGDHVLPWDRVPGWDLYKPYFAGDYKKKIPLWVFGHVHNYQRANAPSSRSDQVAAPAIVVAGGGGASDLSSRPASNQWFPDGWTKPMAQPVYNFVRISIGDKIEVAAYGTSSRDIAFTEIDHFIIER